MRLLCQHWGCFLCRGAARFALDVPLAPPLLCGAGLHSHPSVEIFLCGFVWFSRVWFVQWFRVVLRMLSRAGVVTDGEVTRMVGWCRVRPWLLPTLSWCCTVPWEVARLCRPPACSPLCRKAIEGLVALSEDGCFPISIQQMAYGECCTERPGRAGHSAGEKGGFLTLKLAGSPEGLGGAWGGPGWLGA